MAQSIVGLENVQPYKFSECSKTDYIEALKSGHGICLFNKPNEVNWQLTHKINNTLIELEWDRMNLEANSISLIDLGSASGYSWRLGDHAETG